MLTEKQVWLKLSKRVKVDGLCLLIRDMEERGGRLTRRQGMQCARKLTRWVLQGATVMVSSAGPSPKRVWLSAGQWGGTREAS